MKVIRSELKVEDMVFIQTIHHDLVKLYCPFCRSEISQTTMQVNIESSKYDESDLLRFMAEPPKERKTLRFQCLYCGGKLEIDSESIERLII